MYVNRCRNLRKNVIKKQVENILKRNKDLKMKTESKRNVKTKAIPVIIGATGTISKSFTKYLSNRSESRTSRTYRKHPYWALRTYLKKCKYKSIKGLYWETALHLPQIVTTKRLKYCTPQKHSVV